MKDKVERDAWFSTLKSHIESSEGSTKLITLTAKLPNFWKVPNLIFYNVFNMILG